ncbi:histidine kinase dimerization/phospho-acceptor domain-containing protein [Actinoplanes sp. NPDC051494]|uniref:PAS domain-containing sensor histidine kinase n=1 Tax=Actinoplanes sp. NPDC051494 TaxID=3363907 RepID=UPI0037B01D7A
MGAALPAVAGELLGVTPTGMLVTDPAGLIVMANPALLAAFGAPAGTELAGLPVAELGTTDPFHRAEPLWSAWPDERPHRCPLPHDRLVEGRWHHVHDLRVMTVTDLSAGARVRRRLRQHNRALAELVATKTELVSALLHELRTPLAAAGSMAQLLAEDTGGDDDPMVGDALRAVARNLDRLTAVTDQIALIGGIENGTIELTRTPVPVRDLLDGVARALPEVPVTVTAGEGTVLADPVRLPEALERLTAAVHAISGGCSPVELSAAETDGQWRIRLPLPPDTAADQLFTTTGDRGNATALILARAIVGRHDGTVGIDDNALTVRIPAGPGT